MAKSALPLLIGVGAIALIATSGKKKTAKKKEDLFEIPNGDGGDDVYIPPTGPKTKPKPTDARPSGSPPRGDTYDGAYWNATPGGPRLESIRNHFKDLGYSVSVGPWPMNVMGPLGASGSSEYTNEDGSKGWAGGGDDQPSAVVKQFQADYNRVSKLNKAEKIYAQSMGGLDVDGLVGPLTLNALRYAKEGLPGGKKWSDLLQMASLKGIS